MCRAPTARSWSACLCAPPILPRASWRRCARRGAAIRPTSNGAGGAGHGVHRPGRRRGRPALRELRAIDLATLVEPARAACGGAHGACDRAAVRPPLRRSVGRSGGSRARRPGRRVGVVVVHRDPPGARQPRWRAPMSCQPAGVRIGARSGGRRLSRTDRCVDRSRGTRRHVVARGAARAQRCRPRAAPLGADAPGRNRRTRRPRRGGRSRVPRRARAAASRRVPAGGLRRLPARPRPRGRGAHAAQGPVTRRRAAAAPGHRRQD